MPAIKRKNAVFGVKNSSQKEKIFDSKIGGNFFSETSLYVHV